MRSISRKSFLIAFLLITAVLGTSCFQSDNNDAPSADTAKEQLNLRITWKEYSGRGEAVQRIADVYNASPKSGKYEFKVAGGDEDIAAIEAALVKNDPEMIYVLPYRYVGYFGDKGYLADLTDDFSQDEKFFFPQLWKLGQASGKIYGIPWMGHSVCLIYNKNLLDKAGVDPADIKDLDSLVRAMEAVEASGDAKGIGLVGADHNDVSWMVNQFIYGFGSGLVDESGTKVVINNERSKKALEFYRDVLGSHAQETWADDTGVEVMQYFLKGQIAFEMQGVWGLTDIKKNGNPFEVGVIPLEDIGLYAEVGPMMLAIPGQMSDERKKAAVAFIEFMISKEAQEKIMDGEYSPEHDAYYPFRLPVRKDLTESLVFQEYPEYLPFIDGLKRPSIDVPVPKWQKIKDECYAPGLHRVMTGELAIDDFLKEVETKGNDILSDNTE